MGRFGWGGAMDLGVCGGTEAGSGVGADEVAVSGMVSRGTGSAGVSSLS